MLNNKSDKSDGWKRIDRMIDRMADQALEEIDRMTQDAHRNIEQSFQMAMLEMRIARLEGHDAPTQEKAPAKRSAARPSPSP